MNRLTSTLVIILVVAAIISLGFYKFSRTPEPNTQITTVQGESAGADIIRTLNSLKEVSFDSTVFSDAAFTKLTDINRAILPFPTGRTNPFAPIGQ